MAQEKYGRKCGVYYMCTYVVVYYMYTYVLVWYRNQHIIHSYMQVGLGN